MPESEKIQVPITALDNLKVQMKNNRADAVSEIFAIYDQLPELLTEFKKENLTEDQVVAQLGTLVENILKQFELTQLPLAFAMIKETSNNKSKIIVPGQ